jgi:RNA polymerase sigma-70 factor (ECF subfamily)
MATAHSRRRYRRQLGCRREVVATDELSDLTELVTAAAARLIRQLDDAAIEQEDLEQEFLVRLLEGMPRHDPALGGRNRFAKVLIRRQRVTQLRAYFAEKRRAQKVSLEQPIESDGQWTTLGSTLCDDQRLAATAQLRRTEIDQTDLRLDVKAVIETLDTSEQEALQMIMETASITESAAKLGVARTTFSDRVRTLRAPFQQAGMKEYLQ